MNNYKNKHRRNRFKSNGDRNFRKRNGHKNNGEFSNNQEFRRRNPGKNNQNAAKLVEKYNDLAREALSNGDKILSENYLQHADHFSRILTLQEISKPSNNNVIEQNFKNNSDLTDLNKNTKQDTGEILEKD